MDDVTSETLAELEKTQKDFWNIPRKTGVLLNMFIKHGVDVGILSLS